MCAFKLLNLQAGKYFIIYALNKENTHLIPSIDVSYKPNISSTRYAQNQLIILTAAYSVNNNPPLKTIKYLAKQTNLTVNKINEWFARHNDQNNLIPEKNLKKMSNSVPTFQSPIHKKQHKEYTKQKKQFTPKAKKIN